VAPGTAVTDLAVFTGTGPGSPPNPTSPPNPVFSICGPISASATVLACDGSDSAHTATAFDSTHPWVHCTGVDTPVAGLCSGADAAGVGRARSSSVNKTAVGIYCFKVTWAGDSNYVDGATEIGNATTGSECFRVKDTSSVTTDQKWLPNDSATVKLSDGTTNGSGSVTFTLYDNGTCDDTDPTQVLHTFGPTTLVNGQASTDNTSFGIAVSTGRTISWKVTFTPSDTSAVQGSDSHCESSVVTINDND
jgi:hypothetical protein